MSFFLLKKKKIALTPLKYFGIILLPVPIHLEILLCQNVAKFEHRDRFLPQRKLLLNAGELEIQKPARWKKKKKDYFLTLQSILLKQ